MKRERMTIMEAAAFLAERPAERVAEVDIHSPFPAVEAKLDTEVSRWVRRIRQGTQEQTLACYRNANPRGQAFYRADDLKRWANKLFPRQEALYA